MLSAGSSLKRLISPSVRIACPRSIARETSETRVGQPRCPMLLLRCGPLIESEGTSMPSIRIIVAFATLVIAITPARAQEWPTRPVTMVVPFAAGGPLAEALDTPSVRERMQDLGSRVSAPEHRSPEYLAKLLRSDIERWADRIKAAGIAGQ